MVSVAFLCFERRITINKIMLFHIYFNNLGEEESVESVAFLPILYSVRSLRRFEVQKSDQIYKGILISNAM